MEQMKLNCTGMDTKLADLLLDPERAPAKVREHVDACDDCRAELAELQATMALLDTWEGPAPTPYFITRLDARLREQREAEPAGWPAGWANWFDRLRASFLYGLRTHVRPLAAMALTVLLLLGGGAYLGITNWDQTANPPEAAVVHDLQTLDTNAQLLDQLETLSSNNENGD
jgi:anti-sigma factor RsiW